MTVLDKTRNIKSLWMTPEVLNLHDAKREMKANRNVRGSQQYRETNKLIKTKIMDAKEVWAEDRCTKIDNNLERHNSKNVYQLVRELTTNSQEPLPFKTRTG